MNTKQKMSVSSGFTIVELLIVVVIIAILAAITIVSYNGITQRATTADLTGSLKTAATKIESYKITNELYPTDLSLAQVPNKDGVETRFSSDGSDAFCLSYRKDSTQYYMSNLVKVPTAGPCPQSLVSLVAGSMGSSGYGDNANGPDARFGSAVFGMAVSKTTGNVYLADNADSGDRYIRRITPSGAVTTVANVGFGGLLSGLAVDADENVYALYNIDGTLRRISPAGVVTTVASGFSPSNSTSSIAIDGSGNIYVPEPFENIIKRVTPGGVVTTFVGSGVPGGANGVGTAAQVNNLYTIAFSGDGNLYAKDSNGMRRITTSGIVSTPFTYNMGGDPNAACAPSPIRICKAPDAIVLSGGTNTGIAVDATGYIYMPEAWSAIKRATPNGSIEAVAGLANNGGPEGGSAVSGYTFPWMVGADGQGRIYIMRGSALYRLS